MVAAPYFKSFFLLAKSDVMCVPRATQVGFWDCLGFCFEFITFSILFIDTVIICSFPGMTFKQLVLHSLIGGRSARQRSYKQSNK